MLAFWDTWKEIKTEHTTEISLKIKIEVNIDIGQSDCSTF